MSDPFVVIGGDAAGLSAASKCAREDPERDIIVYEKGRWVSYAHCGTPYFVKGEVDTLSSLLSLSPQDIEERGIDLRREEAVVEIDPDGQTVTVEPHEGDRYTQEFGHLLIATGARAITEVIPGTDLDGVFSLHGLDDAAAIKAFLTDPEAFDVEDLGGSPYVDDERSRYYGDMSPPETVAIVGGGYVGVEMAEAFAAWDLDVNLFQRTDSLLKPFGADVGASVADHLEANGVNVHLDTVVESFEGDGERVTGLQCADGTDIHVDGALVGVGIRPNVDLAETAGIEIGATGAIATDRYGRTSATHIYAAGDCAEKPHAVTNEPAWVPLGLTANRAGRAIGQTVAGIDTPVGDIVGTGVVKAFDLECGRTGIIDPDRARDHGFEPVSETITAGSRSGYYPGAEPTTVHLVADATSGRLIGGSIVGEDRAAIRINVVATALEADMTVTELEQLDLGYAPPFSPVWDPVLVAAKVLAGSVH